MLSVFGVSLSVTDHPELVVHLYNIQIFCFRQSAVKCVVNFQYMYSWLGVKWQTRCQHYLPRERKEGGKKIHKSLPQWFSCLYAFYIPKKGMSEWDGDSSKHFFIYLFLFFGVIFSFFSIIAAFAPPHESSHPLIYIDGVLCKISLH